MECELWPRLYALVKRVGQRWPRSRVRYSDSVIVLVFLWACLHDRPQVWACDVRNWKSTRLRPACLPSDSTLSRRLKSPSVQALMKELENCLREGTPRCLLSFIDGKPLTVGGRSTDREARWGYAAAGMSRGYKLHAIWSYRPIPDAWTVRPMNENESRVAKLLIPQVAGVGYLAADAKYDVVTLHDLAVQHGYQLVAAPHVRGANGLGHHRQSPHRLHSLQLLMRPFGQDLFKQRKTIERMFGNATSFAGGLAPLPSWVRRLHRVQRWVWAKLTINAIRIKLHQGLAS